MKKPKTTIQGSETRLDVHLPSVLVERGKRYGRFDHHAAISQQFKCILRQGTWNQLGDDQREALEMIVHKIARILNGDPNYADSWQDIAGYAQLVANRLNGDNTK